MLILIGGNYASLFQRTGLLFFGRAWEDNFLISRFISDHGLNQAVHVCVRRILNFLGSHRIGSSAIVQCVVFSICGAILWKTFLLVRLLANLISQKDSFILQFGVRATHC